MMEFGGAMGESFSLVFRGEFVAGHGVDAAKRLLCSALKVSPENEARLFSGSRVVIKKGISLPEAERYRQKFERAGIVLHVESVASHANPPPTMVPESKIVDKTPEDASLPVSNHQETPSHPGTQASRLSLEPIKVKEAPKTSEPTQVEVVEKDFVEEEDYETAETTGEDASIWKIVLGNFSFTGRIDRLTFFVGSLIFSALNSILAVIFFDFITSFFVRSLSLKEASGGSFLAAFTGAGLLFAVVGIALTVFSIRLPLRRLQDIGYSGWWALILLIPYVNFVFWLFLVFKSGEEGDNQYGPPPGDTSQRLLAGVLAVLVIIGSGFYFVQSMFKLNRTMVQKMNQQNNTARSKDSARDQFMESLDKNPNLTLEQKEQMRQGFEDAQKMLQDMQQRQQTK